MISSHVQIREEYGSECSKVVPTIKCACTVFIDNFRNISTNSSILVSVCRESYDGYIKHKRNIPTCDLWDSQGNEKCSFYSIGFSINISIRNEDIISEEHKTKKPFEMILHMELVTSLRSWKGSQKLNIHL